MISRKNKASYLLQISNGLVPLIVIPLLSRSTNLEFMGSYFVALSIISATQVIVDYGFNLSAIRSFVRLRVRASAWIDKLNLIVSVTFAKIVLGAVILGLFSIYLLFSSNTSLATGYIYILIGIVLSVTSPVWFFFAIGESFVHALFLLVMRILAIAPLFFLDITHSMAITIMVLPMLTSNIISILYIAMVSRISIKSYRLRITVRQQLVEGWPIFFNSVIVSLIATLWPLFLSLHISNMEIGIYGIAEKIMRGLMTLISPIQNFLLASSNKRKVIDMISDHKFAFIFVFSLIVVIPFVFLMVPNYVLINIFGVSIIGGRVVLNYYAFGFIFGAIHLVAYTEMIRLQQEPVYKYLFLVSLSASIALVLIFDSAIYAPLVTEILISLTTLLWLWKGYLRYNSLKKSGNTYRIIDKGSISSQKE